MKSENIKWATLFISINVFIICFIIIAFLNLSYPRVGHDYGLAIPQMLDTALHFRQNGLSVQWYTPTFGGGLPAYPDPNNSQFSLFVLLTMWVEPWQAVIISSILIVSLGFVATYFLFYRVLRLHWTSSILGAVFFSANGFIMQRIAVGHLGYQTFPLIAILFIALLDPSWPIIFAAMIFALMIAGLIHQAGYFIIVIFGLSMLLSLPIIYIFQPRVISWKRILLVIAFGSAVGLLISASKLSAVYSFMRLFPRQVSDIYTSGTASGLLGIALQLLGTMTLRPFLWLTGLDAKILPNLMAQVTGADYGYWEFDMSLSPVVLGIGILGIDKFIHYPNLYLKKLTKDNKWIALIFLVFFFWVCIEFVLARGLIYPFLQHLPILSSLHVNNRFAAAFLFPFSMVAAIIYNSWVPKWSEKKTLATFLIINIIAIIPLYSYFTIKDDLQYRIYDITESKIIYNKIQAGDNFEITNIGKTKDNTEALSLRTSNLNPYNPIFGYFLEKFHPELSTGSIWNVSKGYYNFTNPSGYVFPGINNTHSFERFRVGDKDILNSFAKHIQPDWKLSAFQTFCNWVSALSFAIAIIFLAIYSFRLFISENSKRVS